MYVGQQVAGVSPCTSSVLTDAQGEADALDASSKMASEGFPPGSYVYLDIERSDLFPGSLASYIAAWTSKLAAGDYCPGIYCHKHNANDVRGTVLEALSDPSAIAPRFWIVGGVTGEFNIGTSQPPDVGVDFADLWQCPASVSRTFGGAAIFIDENVSRWPDPAGPIPT